MDFGILPPEVISALIHSGPGAWSLIQAAGMWHALSTELDQSVSSYTAELSDLSVAWRGPSSTAMAQSLEPYLDWLRMTAQQCQQIATSVEVVTGAFELTHWTVVHPAVVAANRARLAMLLATNFFGVNFPAIAETEAEYHTMWVNNSAAMYRYAATSASAVRLPAFSSPPEVANPAGVTAQTTLVPATTTSNSAAQTAATASAAGQAAATSTSFDPLDGWFGLANQWGNQTIAGGLPVNLLSYLAQLSSAQSLQRVGSDAISGLSEGTAALSSAEARLISAVGSAMAPRGSFGVGISLGGKLTMPPAMVGLLSSAESPVQLASAVSALPVEATQPPFMPMAPMRPPSRGSTNNRRRKGRDYDDIEYGAELPGTVMHRPPSAG
jgi:PPE-repeat protein